MKFLIDGHGSRVALRRAQWAEGTLGQLLTPLTRYSLAEPIFAIDNGAYTKFDARRFDGLLRREQKNADKCLFIALPDVVGNHKQTLELYKCLREKYLPWKIAFVAQDGIDYVPPCADAVFIGGTDAFKDSQFALDLVASECKARHVHVGRVNTARRFLAFSAAGAHTCDGSGVSRYDHMYTRIRDACQHNALQQALAHTL